MTESASVFFEGTEKKIELLVDPRGGSLRDLDDAFWTRVVESCGARILSRRSNDAASAFLLSESSLFVFDHRMLMITCGRTRLVDVLPVLLERVSAARVTGVIYERKNEVFPHVQPSSFFDDVDALARFFPGRAFKFGDEDDHHLYLYHLDRAAPDAANDVTLEILMYGLDPAVAESFRGERGGRAVVAASGVLSGFDVDDHFFEPGGYSLNAMRDAHYRTLHVTPNALHSYASFETNLVGDGPDGLVRAIVSAFRPRAFDVVLFHAGEVVEPEIGGYQRKSHVMEDLSCGYRVRFMSFFKPQAGVSRPVELPLLQPG